MRMRIYKLIPTLLIRDSVGFLHFSLLLKIPELCRVGRSKDVLFVEGLAMGSVTVQSWKKRREGKWHLIGLMTRAVISLIRVGF